MTRALSKNAPACIFIDRNIDRKLNITDQNQYAGANHKCPSHLTASKFQLPVPWKTFHEAVFHICVKAQYSLSTNIALKFNYCPKIHTFVLNKYLKSFKIYQFSITEDKNNGILFKKKVIRTFLRRYFLYLNYFYILSHYISNVIIILMKQYKIILRYGRKWRLQLI